MKQKLIVFFGALLVIMATSCQNNVPTDTAKAKANIEYFQDEKTGLCYAALTSKTYGGLKAVSITCVPCDSLYNTIWSHKNQRNEN